MDSDTRRPEVVADFGTSLLRTTVTRLDQGGYLWRRKPGHLSGRTVEPVAAGLRRALRQVNTTVRVEIAEATSDAWLYRAEGYVSLANALVSGMPVRVGIAEEISAVARAVHGLDVDLAQLRPSPRLAGFAVWLESGAGSATGPRLRDAARSYLGTRRWADLTEWTTYLVAPGDDDVLLHGALGAASVVPAENDRSAVLLTGESLSRGPRSADLGWLLGELHELSTVLDAPRAQVTKDLFRGLIAGCGEGEHERLQHAATVRVAVHMVEYTAFVAWSDHVVRDYLVMIAGLVDGGTAGFRSGE